MEVTRKKTGSVAAEREEIEQKLKEAEPHLYDQENYAQAGALSVDWDDKTSRHIGDSLSRTIENAYKELVPTKLRARNKAITDAHQTAFNNRSLRHSEKIKRRNAYKEKSQTVKQMQKSMEGIDASRSKSALIAAEEMANRFSKAKKEITAEHKNISAQKSNDIIDLADYYFHAKNNMDFRRISEAGEAAAYFSGDQSVALKVYDDLLYDIDHTNLSEFEYKNNNEFMNSFAEKYRKLRAFSHGLEFFEKKEEMKKEFDIRTDPIVLKAKCALIKDILADYENRMDLLQSPYYALMAGKDFDNYSPDQLRELANNQSETSEMRRFLTTMAERKTLDGFKRGASTGELLNEKKEAFYNEYAEKGRETISKFEDEARKNGIQLTTDTNYDEAIKKMIEAEAFVPELTLDTLKDDLPIVSEGINGLFAEEFREMNQATVNIINNPDLQENYNFKPADLENFKKLAEDVAKKQTLLNRNEKQLAHTIVWTTAFHKGNPKFSKEENGKIDNITKAAEKMQATLQGASRALFADFANAEQLLTNFRCEHGYAISENRTIWKKAHEIYEHTPGEKMDKLKPLSLYLKENQPEGIQYAEITWYSEFVGLSEFNKAENAKLKEEQEKKRKQEEKDKKMQEEQDRIMRAAMERQKKELEEFNRKRDAAKAEAAKKKK